MKAHPEKNGNRMPPEAGFQEEAFSFQAAGSKEGISASPPPLQGKFQSLVNQSPQVQKMDAMQNLANNSVQAQQAVQMHQLFNSAGPSVANARSQSVIQRKAFIGPNYDVPDTGGLNPQARAFLNPTDTTVRRFKDKTEMNAFAANPRSQDHIGLVEGKDWVRVDQFTVLGENHIKQTSVKILNAVGTKRFRHEAFSAREPGVMEANRGYGRQIAVDQYEKLEKMGVDEELRDGDHDAEGFIPKMSRVLPDIMAFKEDQGKKGEQRKHRIANVAVPGEGTALKEGYDINEILSRGFLQALEYCKAISEGGIKKHPLAKVYGTYKRHIDSAIIVLNMALDERKMPNYALINPKMLKKVSAAYTKAAHAELGLKGKKAISQNEVAMKTHERKSGPEASRFSVDGMKNDYLRDKSMLDKIIFAFKNDELLFLIGDAHREKLGPHLPGSIRVTKDDTFLEQEKDENYKAEKHIPQSKKVDSRIIKKGSVDKWTSFENVVPGALTMTMSHPEQANLGRKVALVGEGFEEGEFKTVETRNEGSSRKKYQINAKNSGDVDKIVKIKLVLLDGDVMLDEKSWTIPPAG